MEERKGSLLFSGPRKSTLRKPNTNYGRQRRFVGIRSDLPDAKLAPGDTFDVAAVDVCVPGYAKKVRAVPAWLKRQAYAEYGITQYKTGGYEVDHLIPLSLGGSISIRNLWPQSTKTSPWNSYVKDALERKLHKLVCASQLDLKIPQREIASDWIEAYQKYAAKTPPPQAA